MRRHTTTLTTQTTKHERLLQTFEQLARYRQLDRKTIAECAVGLNVSARTINNYLADDRYEQTVARMRVQWREDGITSMGNLVATALDTLLDVMQHDESGHARFEAAAKVLELYGVQVLPEQQHVQDDAAELDRLTRLLATRPTTVNVYQTPPEPGGYLPQILQETSSVDRDYLPARMLRHLGAPESRNDDAPQWVEGLRL